MRKMKFTVILLGAALLSGCGGAKEPAKTESLTQEEQNALGESLSSKIDAMMESALSGAEVELPEIAIGDGGNEGAEDPIGEALDSMQSAMLEGFVGEVDLAGSWQDEVSKRAVMTAAKNEDGSYSILIKWGGSAAETACWEITGTWNADIGGFAYEDGKYYVLKNGEEKTGEETTKGGFFKENEKVRWNDSKLEEDALFVRG